ncbi:MAG: F0F1 ATP synthase subunit delta, partial [Paramuribaculum sp.]|nr:F0F1 ATP synthase subunit delta [Paramuribaculum sp.]
LKALITRHLGNGTMELTSTVNPDLIGGFRISIGNEVLDASVANELQQLKLALSKTV